jgi:hypothetical protein
LHLTDEVWHAKKSAGDAELGSVDLELIFAVKNFLFSPRKVNTFGRQKQTF